MKQNYERLHDGTKQDYLTSLSISLRRTPRVLHRVGNVVAVLATLQPAESLHEIHDVISYAEELLKEGHTLSQILKDCMQVETILMSMEDARRSIEETASLKYLTQLAFIFVPLTFATSIFGMNVKEMTGTGPRIWTLIITAVRIVGAVLFSWARNFHPDQFPRFYKSDHLDTRQRDRILHFLVGVRFGIFLYMIRHGVLPSILTWGYHGPEFSLETVKARLVEKEYFAKNDPVWPPGPEYN